MSFTITTDVFCDKCGDWIHGVAASATMKAEAWAKARTSGWSKKDGKHVCPMCNGKAEYRLSEGRYIYKEVP